MALNRREFLVSVPLAASGAWACSATTQSRASGGYVELAHSVPSGEKRGTVLVAMPETAQTKEVWTGLNDELGKECALVAIRAEGPGIADVIQQGMQKYKPSGIVLMNNPTVAAYRTLQRSSGAKRFPAAVIVMTSFLDGQPQQLASATGISYEVPLITAVTNLRKLIATPVERVGVVLRPGLRGFVARQIALAKREQISVVTQEVGQNANSSELKWALRRLKSKVDAVWILNDDRCLSPKLISEGWLPGLNERPFKPTIVGAASLVSPSLSFGTFAVLPDHTALGVQAAGLVFDIADNNWSVPDDAEVQLPLSTTTSVDLVQARERFSLRADALKQVDRILE
jgi:ABC-type uncharacterized transport system substrate-binding protein